MFNAKKLTEDQTSTIKQWAADGAQLNDIQKKIEGEMDLKITYMDVRFLVLDLEITIRDIEAEEAVKKAEEDALKGPDEIALEVVEPDLSGITEGDVDVLPPATAVNSVVVTVDSIAKPGLMASGRVTFSDGETGDWYIDEAGLGINPDNDDCEPTRSDIESFQLELRRLMDSQ